MFNRRGESDLPRSPLLLDAPALRALYRETPAPLEAPRRHQWTRAPYARRDARRQRHRAAHAVARPLRRAMVADAPRALLELPQRATEPATAWPPPWSRVVAATAWTVVVRRIVVVTETEEPDEPHDQQSDIEDAEADHEDPSFGRHPVRMVPPGKRELTQYPSMVRSPQGRRRPAPPVPVTSSSAWDPGGRSPGTAGGRP